MREMNEGSVFDVQRFSLHDGPGIRTVVFFKGCPLRCRWCQNPEGLRAIPEITFHAERCVEARACHAVCPRDAIGYDNGAGRVRWERCDYCGLCADACPGTALQLVGRYYEVDELIALVRRDLVFFQQSGGGVTVSGGEPTLQMDFLTTFLSRCQEQGLHTAIETCGWVEWERLERVLPFCNLVLYDVKAIDPILHRQLTGQDNARILENLRRLVARDATVIPRVPLIPTQTATPQNLNDIVRFLRELGLTRVHLLPYHRLGQAKLPRLANSLPPLSLALQTPTELDAMADLFRAAGLSTVVGGM